MQLINKIDIITLLQIHHNQQKNLIINTYTQYFGHLVCWHWILTNKMQIIITIVISLVFGHYDIENIVHNGFKF